MVTSASAQISDSWTSPPVAKMPTTVQSLSRNAMREPTPSPANCCAAFRPTITSRTPRSKRPPLHDPELVADGEGGRLRRRGRARCWDRSRPGAGRSTITTSSADASGRPAGSRATPGRRAQQGGLVARHAARQLGVGPGAQQDHAVRAPGAGERVAEALRHRQHRHEHAHHAGDADDHDQRGAQPLRQGAQVDQRDLRRSGGAQRAQRCPASASTIRSRRARSAGGSPIARRQRRPRAPPDEPGPAVT